MRKIIVGFAIIITSSLAVLILAIVLSPYSKHPGDADRAVKQTILIDANPRVIFNYLGNSSNAAFWSVYVDHIVTLNGAEIKDGMPGSIRRCFKQPDEKGVTWDELITIVDPERKRQLTIFNMVGFPLQAEGLASEQLYEKLSPNQTRLTFTLFYLKEPGVFQILKTYFASYIVSNIFEKNLKNIKANIEKGKAS